jgi:hypothetical protein
MKLTSRLEKLKQQKSSTSSDWDISKRPTVWFSTSTWVLLGLCLALGGLGALAVLDSLIKIPPELVGYWEVQEGPQKGGTFEFFRNGTMEVHLQSKKKLVTHKAHVTVRDKALVMANKDPLTREETRSESIIRELTADTLILELEKGDVLKMVRIE